MNRTIKISPKARSDIRRNSSWLRSTFSPRKADRWNNDIVAEIEDLVRGSDQYPEADEATELEIPLRCKLSGRRPHVFRILFIVTDEAVVVLRVRHAAQDLVTEDDL